ncbi:S46 family peptidase [Polluticoccus soli]|uniref:S46 family peptidase n=1 Tax=Polluticoccus soli TaxID=3034150 RepID=UPI0023E351A0|nr:S46 family peptidase [Flavipsychrobacter sp. JY13-12]
MWLPPTLKSRENDMKEMGLQIPVEKLYSEDGTGLNNAVVLFGKGCTGEIISPKGLLLTNHHCGYGTVQGLSSKEKDYFANGFWAKSQAEELPCPGLTVSFIRKMENVTQNILSGLPDTLNTPQRDSIIATRIKNLEAGYRFTTKLDASIKPYYNGNQYWVSIIETFRDVRLVGFPPNGVGTFGGDTDNWMWPRHTGDFSMFRVYAGKDNKPADYSKDNKPYTTPAFFTINASGYKEGDFTMVYGFPGTTMEYISSYQLNHIANIIDPIRIEARTKKLDVWNENMQQSRDVFLKYTSKKASLANGWKKWQGEVRGLKLNNVPAKKQAYEAKFQGWANTDTEMPYLDDLLAEIGARSQAANPLIKQDEYIKEVVYGVELLQQASILDRILKVYRSGINGNSLQDTLAKIAAQSDGFYKNYDVATDKQVFRALMPMYFEQCSTCVPPAFSKQFAEQGRNYESWAAYVFRSLASDKAKLNNLATSVNPKDSTWILADPAWQLYSAINTMRQAQVLPGLNNYYNSMAYLNRLYMNGQMKLDNTRQFYPDANLTLRLTYGTVQGIDPDGPAGYSYQTNLTEAVAKDNPEVEEFRMPQKLKDLYQAKDFGKWQVNSTVPLAFIASNHTSGGNSGSPILNAKGELIGTNFDRIWEGTMSDLYFDPNLCRNISLDVRYTLFIIEKLGGAGWLLNEMKIVKK